MISDLDLSVLYKETMNQSIPVFAYPVIHLKVNLLCCDMEDTVTVYDVEIPKDLFENLEEYLDDLNPSRNYGKKATVKQSLLLADYLIEKEIEESEKSISHAERRIAQLRETID